jgi:hypothetical protein
MQVTQGSQDVNGPPLNHREADGAFARNLFLQRPPIHMLHDDEVWGDGQVRAQHFHHILRRAQRRGASQKKITLGWVVDGKKTPRWAAGGN